MTIENQHDVDGLKRVGRIVSLVLHKMLDALEPGMTTRELDAIGARLLEEHGARSAPQLTYGFPAATCVSVNEEAAHGVPGDRVIRAGDLVNVDVSAELDRLRAERDKLQKFKDYVQARLDAMGVPADPDSPHKAEGCRVGGRLDWVAERVNQQR